MMKQLNNEQGQAMSEYLILVMLVAVAAITATTSVGRTVFGKLNQIHKSIDTTVTLDAVRN